MTEGCIESEIYWLDKYHMALFQVCYSISWSDPVTFGGEGRLQSWTVDASGSINLWWLNSCLSLGETDYGILMWTYEVLLLISMLIMTMKLVKPSHSFLCAKVSVCQSVYLSVSCWSAYLSVYSCVSPCACVTFAMFRSVPLCVFVSFCLLVLKPFSSSVSFLLRFWLSLRLPSQLLNPVTLISLSFSLSA